MRDSNGGAVQGRSESHKRKRDNDGYSRQDDRRKKVRAFDEKLHRHEKQRGERDRGVDRDKDLERVMGGLEKPVEKNEGEPERHRSEKGRRDRDNEEREKEGRLNDTNRDREKDGERNARNRDRDTNSRGKKAETQKYKEKDRPSHSRAKDVATEMDFKAVERKKDSREGSGRLAESKEDRGDKYSGDEHRHSQGKLEKEVSTAEAKPDSDALQDSDMTYPANGSIQGNGKMLNVENSSLKKDGNADQHTKRSNLSTPTAVAKAKRALEMQKLLSDKLKRLPQVSRTATQSSIVSSPLSAPVVSSSPVASTLTSSRPTAVQTPGGVDTGLSPFESMSANADLLSPSFHFLPSMAPSFPGVNQGMAPVPNYEALKRVQEVANRLGIHQVPGSLPFLGMLSEQMTEDFGTAGHHKGAKAPVLRLDAQGREIDEHGNVLERTKISNLSTLKVNINKQKKESFQILHPELEDDPINNPYFDSSMGIDKTKLLRPRRPSFQFVEEGSWSRQAEMMRLKSQFGEAQAKEIKLKQAVLAKAKAEPDINPNLIEISERVPVKEKPKDQIPDVEWWDAVLLPSNSYNEVTNGVLKVKMEKLTILVEHPVPIEHPAEPAPPPPQPLTLTKKERKKLHTQRRLAKEKDRQEMIRQGLLEPPKPKVKMSNLMKVLGAEATQDPTKLEMQIRAAAAEREQAHADRNLARKLTPAERREKKERKLFDDPNTLETIVSVYRISDLSHAQTRFKVTINAQENRLTGFVLICDTMNVVIVEGGLKSIKRYAKLMLQRINWAAAVKEDDEAEREGFQEGNRCVLVWQGSVAKPSFEKFLVQQCRTEAAGRKYLADAGVGHYWDLAANFVE